MRTTIVKCKICNKDFERPSKEVNRNIKKNTAIICSKQCQVEWGKITIKLRKENNGGMSAEWMRSINPSKRDELSPFRNLIRKLKGRRRKDCHVTMHDIKSLWEKQNGKCAITGVKMILPPTTAHFNIGPKCASIDRINNDDCYTPDNIQLVCYSVNLARNVFSIEEIKSFFRELVDSAGIVPASFCL